jgi:DNA-binding CsgD family transcriptional regulator
MSGTAPKVQAQGSVTRVLAALGGEVDAALERISLPAFVVDPDGRVRYLNGEARSLYGEAVGRPIVDFVAPESAMSARISLTRQLLGTQSVSDTEVWTRTLEGDVLAEVHSVAIEAGEHVVAVFGIVAPGEVRPPPLPAWSGKRRLTPRQHEVLLHLAAGESTDQISAGLHVAPDTVRNHVRAILRTLGTHSRLEAVVEARRLGLIV